MQKLTFEELTKELGACVFASGIASLHCVLANARHRLFMDVGTHGQEYATPMALLELVRGLHGIDWPWPNVALYAVISDGTGFDEQGYGFIGADKSESCWPPLWGYHQDRQRYWTFVDRNSAWGNTARSHLPEAHLKLREILDNFKPTFALSCHETIDPDARDPFWAGVGLAVLEFYPVSPFLEQRLVGIPNPMQNPLGFVGYLGRRWATFLTGKPRWKRNAKILAQDSNFALVGQICDRYVASGGDLVRPAWQRYFELGGDITTGRGRLLFSIGHRQEADWLTLSEYCLRNHGIPSITTESSAPGEIGTIGLDTRVRQNLLFMKATLDTLNELP